MKKIFLAISSLSLVIGLVAYLFKLSDFDFLTSLNRISELEFPDVLGDFKSVLDKGKILSDFGSQDAEWYDFIKVFVTWLGALFSFPIVLIVDVCKTLICAFQAVMIILGFY